MSTIDPRERFTATVDDYVRHRPSYPPALIDWLADVSGHAPPAPLADIGCGTGISSRFFAQAGYRVTGVDPNPAMLERAQSEAGTGANLTYVEGQAEATGLPASRFALVVAGQAWHWFDMSRAVAEFRRIGSADAYALAFWNQRGATPFCRAYDALLEQASPDYRQVPTVFGTLKRLRAVLGSTEAVEGHFANAQRLSRAGLRGRAASSSYVAHGVADKAAFFTALDAIFFRYQEDDQVEMAYDTVALAWRLN